MNARATYPSPIVFAFLILLSVPSGCTPGGSGAVADQPLLVSVTRVSPTLDEQRLRYSGTLEASTTLEAAFPVPGVVSQVLVVEGQAVRKGEVLARLDDTSFREAFSGAEAAYRRAQDAVERLRPMHEADRLPDIEWVKAETGLQEAGAARELAAKNLSDTELRALGSGLVGRRSIEVGAGAIPYRAALTIVQIDEMTAVVPVHENEIRWMAVGMTASVTVPALGDRTWSGTVREIGVVADPLSHTYTVKVSLPNPDHALRPGMIGNVLLTRTATEPTLALPMGAVVTDDAGRPFVYTVDASAGVARKVFVSVGEYINTGIEVTSGLTEGDQVVVAGQHRLYDGAPVRTSDAPLAAGGANR